MTTTLMNVQTDIAQASLGMPVADRSRCSWQRGPVTVGVDYVAAAHTSALVDAVIEGAFPGAPAWSPPS